MLAAPAARVQQALRDRGVLAEVVELPASTHTARDAAAAIGCTVAEIAKSLVFRGESGRPILVIASGAGRVDEAALAAACGEPVAKADAAFILERTGFDVGGVPPLGHHEALETWFDPDLLRFERIWAAAGTPHAVFPIGPAELLRATGARLLEGRGG